MHEGKILIWHKGDLRYLIMDSRRDPGRQLSFSFYVWSCGDMGRQKYIMRSSVCLCSSWIPRKVAARAKIILGRSAQHSEPFKATLVFRPLSSLPMREERAVGRRLFHISPDWIHALRKSYIEMVPEYNAV
jgi:hypothetical protein